MKNNSLKVIIAKIKELSQKLDKAPQQVTFTDLMDAGIPQRDIARLGGLPLIKSANFPLTDKDLAVIEKQKSQKTYVGKLEKQVAKSQITDELIMATLKKIVVPVRIPKPKVQKKRVRLKRDVVAMLNDTHYGLHVDPSEIGETNAYNWQIACRRTAMFAHQVADYKVEKRHEVGTLHLVLNGDLIQGLIHDTQGKTQDLLGIQQNVTIHILSYLIGHVAQSYKKVVVYCTHGNHDDNVVRREGGRITSHKSKDSFLTPVYFALSLAFRKTNNVSFVMSKGLYVDIPLMAGRAVATHGDTLFSKQLGNPGSSLNTRSLSDAINRWNSGELDKGRKKATLFLLGHTHVHSEFTTFDGVRVVIAPSLSGVDNYAHSLSINHNQVGQVIFESTAKYIYGDSRMVKLLAADKDKSLDAIIPTYTGKLSI